MRCTDGTQVVGPSGSTWARRTTIIIPHPVASPQNVTVIFPPDQGVGGRQKAELATAQRADSLPDRLQAFWRYHSPPWGNPQRNVTPRRQGGGAFPARAGGAGVGAADEILTLKFQPRRLRPAPASSHRPSRIDPASGQTRRKPRPLFTVRLQHPLWLQRCRPAPCHPGPISWPSSGAIR